MKWRWPDPQRDEWRREDREARVARDSVAKWMDLADQVDLQVQGSTRLVYTSTNKALVLAGQLGVDIENTLSLKTVAGVDAKIARGSRESQSSGAPLKDRPFDLVQAATDALARTKGDLIRVRDARKNERRYVKVRAWAVCGGMAAKAVHPEHEADRRVVWWAGEAPEASFFLAGNVKNFVTPLAEGLLPDGGAPIRWNPSDYGGSDKMVTYLARAAVEDGDRDDEVFPEDWTHRMLLTFGLEERWGTSPAIEEGWYDFVFRCDDARTLVEPAGLDVVRRRHWKDTRRHVCLVGSPLWVARAERPTYGWYRVGRCHVVCDESYAVEGHPVEPGGLLRGARGGTVDRQGRTALLEALAVWRGAAQVRARDDPASRTRSDAAAGTRHPEDRLLDHDGGPGVQGPVRRPELPSPSRFGDGLDAARGPTPRPIPPPQARTAGRRARPDRVGDRSEAGRGVGRVTLFDLFAQVWSVLLWCLGLALAGFGVWVVWKSWPRSGTGLEWGLKIVFWALLGYALYGCYHWFADQVEPPPPPEPPARHHSPYSPYGERLK
ncbi:hypothetical protein [Segniliparus rugosus]|uniref:Uncharacterized protein n=1 Tax=Segniliparus rugosus (strain ATCC BAA-974 / DSM 45345 / CCUG 50838 / CIP 108380 / JCM 13579 / CDC 945) TaxID=679197 RepID=U1N8A5_SEGRC|nr:hypothetical protein [Segniliparus rugosus]ERG69108.1 hypothetical protein HMPREF9336_04252 [Segniliparus rugosus ATCC BAA-974]